jgi:speckle-type POZ protein
MFNKDGHRLLDDFAAALTDPAYSDMTLHVSGESLECHRFVLCARSPVFRAMLTGSMLEATCGCVEIADFDTKVSHSRPIFPPPLFYPLIPSNAMQHLCQVVRELLRFMYTEKCSESNLLDDTASLLAAATKYQVEGLVDYCEEVLCASLNVDTVCELLMLADLYHAPVLKENCINFIIQNANDVMIKGTIADLDAALRQEV